MSDIDQGRPPRAASAEKLERARRKVAALKGFYTHLLVFVLINALLVGVNAATGGPWWVQWIILGWGIGVLAHGLAVLSPMGKAVAGWEARKLKQFMAEDD